MAIQLKDGGNVIPIEVGSPVSFGGYILPSPEELQEQLEPILNEILRRGGEVTGSFLTDLTIDTTLHGGGSGKGKRPYLVLLVNKRPREEDV